MEEIGIGIDIEDISRFKGIKANRRLLDNVFTEKENKYCLSKNNSSPHFAARFAGKESIIKACSSIGQIPLSYKEIEITNNKKGVPIVRLGKKIFDKFQIKLTLSHCEDKVVAFAIIVNKSFYNEKN